MADFSQNDKFNPEAGFSSIRFSGDGFVLETELNEMQKIFQNKVKTIFKNYLTDGIFNLGTTEYNAGVFTIRDEVAVIDGEILQITTLTIEADEGEDIYLDMWTKEVTFEDALKRFGNEQTEDTVPNEILDQRALEETTRRFVTAFNITKTTGEEDHQYLLLGTITDGEFEQKVSGIGGKLDKSGGTMEGPLTANSNNQYATRQVRNIIVSTADPTEEDGQNGDIWFKYAAE